MKHNTIYTILLSAVVSLFSGCSFLLDKSPYGQFTSDQINDNSIPGLLAAAYAGLNAHYFGNNEAFAGPSTNWIMEVRSDDAYKGGDGITMESNIHLLETGVIYNDNISLKNKWQNNFYAITRCHSAMNAILSANSLTEDQKKQYLGELRILRAWYYFDMARIFKHVPYFTYMTPKGTKVTNTEFTQDSIMRMLCLDLDTAYADMQETAPTPARFCRYTAAALHAKISAQVGDWKAVKTWANIVIESGTYSLYPNFLDMSKIEYNNLYESIIALQVTVTSDKGQINWSNLLNTTYSDGNLYGTGDDFYLASQNLANAYRTDANGLPYLDEMMAPAERMSGSYRGNIDPRIDFTMGRIGLPFRGRDHIYTKKWCRNYEVYGEFSGKKWLVEPENPLMVKGFPWGASPLNFIFLRYADILLLKAEACVELREDMESARQIVNTIRNRAMKSVDASYVPVDVDVLKSNYKVGEYPASLWTQDYARQAVRMERRLELAMEGHRWFDLCRWGNTAEHMNHYYLTESQYRSYLNGAHLSEDDVYMPTPKDELQTANGLYE